MTWVALMVVELTVPSTSTLVPFLMALAEIVLDPFLYFVDEVPSTVTFWSAEVVMMNPDLDTLVTVPDDPPAAGPDRVLDPPPDPSAPGVWALEVGCAADAAGDARKPTESPTMGAKNAAATMLRHFFFVSTRRTFGLRSCWAFVIAAERSGEDCE